MKFRDAQEFKVGNGGAAVNVVGRYYRVVFDIV